MANFKLPYYKGHIDLHLDDELVKKDVAETSCVMANLEIGKEYNYSVKATYFKRESVSLDVG